MTGRSYIVTTLSDLKEGADTGTITKEELVRDVTNLSIMSIMTGVQMPSRRSRRDLEKALEGIVTSAVIIGYVAGNNAADVKSGREPSLALNLEIRLN